MKIFNKQLTSRGVIFALCFAVVGSVVSVPSSAFATSTDEKQDCQTENFWGSKEYKVANKGKYYQLPLYDGQAKLTIRKKVTDGKNRYCAILVNHTKPGKDLWMSIKLGKRKQGNTNNKVTWYKGSTYKDKGYFFAKTDGVAVTPGKGYCVVVLAKAGDSKKNKDRLKVTYNLCQP